MSNPDVLGSHLVVRLSQAERSRLDANVRALDTTKSAYVRSLLSLPLSVVGAPCETTATGAPDALLVYDDRTFEALRKQLRAWGYHYDQAVHALNTIASKRYMSAEDAVRLVGKANSLLGDIDGYRAEIEARLDRVEHAELVRLEGRR